LLGQFTRGLEAVDHDGSAGSPTRPG
jgi:hypothetical protein